VGSGWSSAVTSVSTSSRACPHLRGSPFSLFGGLSGTMISPRLRDRANSACTDHFRLLDRSARIGILPSLTTGRAPTMGLVEKVKDAASPVFDMAGPVVMQALERAAPLMDMALEKANPYIEQAKEVATPYVEVAREMTAPLLESTINKAGPLAEKISVTYGPIVDQAFEKAGPLVEKASEVARDIVEATVFAVDTATGGRFHDQFANMNQLVGQVLSRNGQESS
jgi:vacuolar-type H+-ATPase subunit H